MPANLPRLLKRLYRFRQRAARPGPGRIFMRRRKEALRAALVRGWTGGYVLTEGGELAFIPAPLDARGERLMFYGFAAPTGALAFAPKDGVAIDVGANLGEWSVPLAKAVGRDGQVLCVEPNTVVADALAATLRVNNFQQARVLPVALSEADGAGHLSVAAGDSGLSRLIATAADGTVAVSLRSLDSIVAEHGLARLDLVKIDVEGHERQVLAGSIETLRRFRPALVFESGHESGDDRAAIARMLDGAGYDIVAVLHDYGALVCTLDDYATAAGAFAGSEARNVLALPRPRP
jgi:FkbM family methyltransferase